MFNHEIFAVSFGRTVELLRQGAPLAEQKSALRSVFALTSAASATLRAYQDMLTVDDVGIPDTLEFIPGLIEQMRVHAVAEISIAKGAEPTELLALARGLAADPGPEVGVLRIKRRLRKARSMRVMVIPVQPDQGGGGHRPPSISQAFELEAIEEAAKGARPGTRGAAPPDSVEEFIHLASQMIELPAEGPREPPAEVEQASRVISSRTPLSEALAQAAGDPFGPDILQRLTALGRQIDRAISQNEIEAAVHALAAVVAWESEAPEGSVRNAYGITVRRTLTRDALKELARHVGDPRLDAELAKILRRGVDVVEVLLELLSAAESIRERKAFMTVLRTMPEGFAGVVKMLGDRRWFVVRNVAELMGEHRIAEAVPDLENCLVHADARVRRAAAIALAKIGTAATVEPLRRILKTGDADLRPLVAASIGGPGSRGLAMPLVALAESEEDPEILREYYLALGRIGTQDAVNALALASKPGGRLFGRRLAAPRAAAVEGLRIAGGKAAVTALEALAEDSDRAIKEAARTALEEVKARLAGGAAS